MSESAVTIQASANSSRSCVRFLHYTEMHRDLVLAQRVEGDDEQRAGVLREISLKRRYNQLSAIFRLPIDLLRHVFGLTRETHNYYVEQNFHWSRAIGWIPEITHVCHAWREVALESPLLWNDVFIDTQSTALWATEFIRRSQNVPITLTMDFLGRNNSVREWKERLLRENMKRLRKIRLDFIAPPLILPCSPVETGQDVSATALEELRIVINGFELSPDSPTILLTEEMLRAPALNKLSLHNCSIDWNAFGLLRNLRHLHVENIDFRADADVNAVRNALAQMPKLETLNLRERQCAEGHAMAPLAPTVRSADLPLLRSITIYTESSTWLSSFLPSIAYGPQRDLEIRGTCDTSRVTDTIAEQFDCTMRHGDGSSIRRAHLMIYNMGMVFAFHGWRTSSTPSVEFGIQGLGQDRLPDKDIVCFIQRLRGGLFRLQNLEVLSLNTNICIPTNIWAIFGCLPKLHTIEIWDKITGLGLFSALVYNNAAATSGVVSSTDHPTTLPFRNIQSISILRGGDEYSEEDRRFILQCLGKRFHLHAPLKRLGIYRGNGLDLFALREVVESVVVNPFFLSTS